MINGPLLFLYGNGILLAMEIREKIEEVAKKHDIQMIVLFGSKAKGNTHSRSDTDVAFLVDKEMSVGEEFDLTTDIGGALGSNIDPVNIKSASPLTLYHVFRYGKLLYEEEKGLFSDYLARALRLYEETMPLYEARLAML